MGIDSQKQKSKFLVLGRVGMDLYPINQDKIAAASNFEPALGGSSGNIAAGLARLGEEVEIVSLISNDPVGDYVRNECLKYGIGTTYLGVAPKGTNTSLALAENRLDDFGVVIYRNRASDLYLDLSHIEKIDFAVFDTLVVTGTALSASPSREAALQAMQKAKRSVLDLDYRIAAWRSEDDAKASYEDAISLADIILGNDDEFAILGGQPSAKKLGKDKLAIYKMGEKGAITYGPNIELKTDIFKVDALKPVGAGDAFMAGFLSGLVNDKPLERAVIEGAANAAIVVSRPACSSAMATRKELDAFLDKNGY